MAMIRKNYLNDKDIRELEIKEKRYMKVVGEPKELVIFVNPKGSKTFALRTELNNKSKMIKLKTFREGIYSVAQARKDACNTLKSIYEGTYKKILKTQNNFENLFYKYLEFHQRRGNTQNYIEKIENLFELYMLPTFKRKNIREIQHCDLLEVLQAIFNPNSRHTRLETIHRLIAHLKSMFDLALRHNYINNNPALFLNKEFPSVKKYNTMHNIDTRLPALTNINDIKEFIISLKTDNTISLQTKNAIYLQILTASRPANVANAKWCEFDFKNGFWIVPAEKMKTRLEHKIALSSYAIEVLKKQRFFSFNDFVFSSNKNSDKGHLNRDAMSLAIRRLDNAKFHNKVCTHGFRATFKTICTLYEDELFALGVGEKVVENALAHQENNRIIQSYERQRTRDEKLTKLMQWYGDFLNKIEKLF